MTAVDRSDELVDEKEGWLIFCSLPAMRMKRRFSALPEAAEPGAV